MQSSSADRLLKARSRCKMIQSKEWQWLLLEAKRQMKSSVRLLLHGGPSESAKKGNVLQFISSLYLCSQHLCHWRVTYRILLFWQVMSGIISCLKFREHWSFLWSCTSFTMWISFNAGKTFPLVCLAFYRPPAFCRLVWNPSVLVLFLTPSGWLIAH